MHLALFCPPYKSHIAVFQCLAGALKRRGHRVTLMVNAGVEPFLDQHVPVATIEGTSRAEIEAIIARAAAPGGPLGILRTVHDGVTLSEAICRSAPSRLAALRVDAIVADQTEPAAGLVARFLNLPLISIACAVPMERGSGIPLPFLPWPYDASEKGLKRNAGGERVSRLLLSEQRRLIRRWAGRFALAGDFDDLLSCSSDLATIAQITTEFDFPRENAGLLHCVGPIRDAVPATPLPIEPEPGRPFVFMSLGTLQGHRFRLFKTVAAACRKIGAQLLVAHCGGLSKSQEKALGATWVTDFVPQRAVLERADLCVTHGGINTVLDALSCGTPMLVLPIAFDQPGVGARVVHHGVGLRLSPRFLTQGRVTEALARLLADPTYAQRASAFGGRITAAGGLQEAVSIIEDRVDTRLAGGRGAVLRSPDPSLADPTTSA